ncbi:MAG: glycosyltransferase family 2 protein [Opitutaceae bacterium]|nr:glycosyltransferase family 2 protein [Opitutaceae bacterium]
MSNPISIVMRSFNDGPLIGATLRAVHAQDWAGGIDLVHIDSGSKDDTVPIIRSFKPRVLIEIQPHEYVPGRVLNRGMREARGDWVVFLNSDAEPADRRWLAELLAVAHAGPRLGTVFSRQIPRPDCQAVYAHDYDRCFGPERESRAWDHFFSMVSCAVYRPAWTEQPFREDLQYAEDDEWSRRLKDHGWGVAFADRSIAIHSHNYTLRQAYKRCHGDSFAAAATQPERRPKWSNWIYGVALPWLSDLRRDWAWCARAGRRREFGHCALVRLWQRCGKTVGFRRGWRHYHQRSAA